MAFGSMAPNSGQMGLALLKQIQGLQGGGAPGGMPAAPVVPGGGPDAAGNWPAAPDAAPPNGMPNFVNNGMISKLMAGNPGGLIGALMSRRTAPVNPGAPPVAGDPAYAPGDMAQGPMAGGHAQSMGGIGLLSKMFGGG